MIIISYYFIIIIIIIIQITISIILEHLGYHIIDRRSLERQYLCDLVNLWWCCNVLSGCIG